MMGFLEELIYNGEYESLKGKVSISTPEQVSAAMSYAVYNNDVNAVHDLMKLGVPIQIADVQNSLGQEGEMSTWMKVIYFTDCIMLSSHKYSDLSLINIDAFVPQITDGIKGVLYQRMVALAQNIRVKSEIEPLNIAFKLSELQPSYPELVDIIKTECWVHALPHLKLPECEFIEAIRVDTPEADAWEREAIASEVVLYPSVLGRCASFASFSEYGDGALTPSSEFSVYSH